MKVEKMHWKVKATIQNAISLLPSSVSYAAYYWVQRQFGGLRRVNPSSRLRAGIETWKRIEDVGYNPVDKVFFEVGTGRTPIAPLAYWLMGAKKIVTVDLNRYLKAELIKKSLQYISGNRDEIQSLFGLRLNQKRFSDLLKFQSAESFSLSAFLDLCQIHYIAPGDASRTGLPERSIDFHTSYTVFEHIPPQILTQILHEGNRIIAESGLFVHRTDFSDHFSHSDKNISSINFLQYSDAQWESYAGNRYMYMNRLRHDDLLMMLESVGHRILAAEPDVDQRLLEMIQTGRIEFDARFRGKSREVLSTIGSWVVTQKLGRGSLQ